MNHYSPELTAGNAVDAANIRAFLQQAVDHYPRLAAFSFTLVLQHRETLIDYHALILRFHTEVWQRTGQYSQARQRERRSSPPTLLRWVWEAANAPECKMVLMLNLDTMGSGASAASAQHVENAMQAMGELLREAWLSVCGAEHNCVTNLTSVILNRSGLGVFTMRFSQLKATAQGMTLPVMTARSSAAG